MNEKPIYRCINPDCGWVGADFTTLECMGDLPLCPDCWSKAVVAKNEPRPAGSQQPPCGWYT